LTDSKRRRETICSLGVMGIWATASKNGLQLDPPETALMASKRITMAMIGNEDNFLDCRLHDGVI